MTGLWFDFICAGAGGNCQKRNVKKQYGLGANGENAKLAAKPVAQPKPTPVIAQATTQN